MEDLASQIESLLGSSSESGQSAGVAAAAPAAAEAAVEAGSPAGAGPEASPKDDLGSQVEQMLDDAISKVNEIREQTQGARAEARAGAGDVNGKGKSELDRDLDALTKDESAAKAGTPGEPVSAGPQEVAPAPSQVQEEAAFKPARPKVEPAEPKPAQPDRSLPTQEAPPPPVAAPVEAPAIPKRLLGERVRPLVAMIAAPARRALAGAGGAVVGVLGWPLSKQQPLVRDSVGWVAVVTVFMGACMWAAVMLRDPKPFVPAIAPVTISKGEGEGGEGGEAKKDAHAKKEAHGGGESHAKKAEGHGGGEHGGAAAAPVKREPLIQPGKPGAKKDAKKAEGHGEGH